MDEKCRTDIPQTLEELFRMHDDHHNTSLAGSMNQVLEMKARKKGVPIHGTFELTPLCNLDCKMCYVHLTTEQMGNRKLLTVDQWKSLMKQAVDAGMMDATLTGGECLTYLGFEELYLYLQSMGIRVTVLTNGLLLDEEKIHFFCQHRPKGIQVTLYGDSDDDYERVTGKRCFDKIVRHILLLKEAGIPYLIAITPNRFMREGGMSLVRFVHSLGVPFMINTSLFSPREETGRRGTSFDIETEDYIALHTLRRKLDGKTIVSQPECELPSPSQSGTPISGLLCSAGNSSFCISWDGRMTPCSAMQLIEESPLQSGFARAWGSIHGQVVKWPLPEECGTCDYRYMCPSCVMIHCKDAPLGHASKKVCAKAQGFVRAGLSKYPKKDEKER